MTRVLLTTRRIVTKNQKCEQQAIPECKTTFIENKVESTREGIQKTSTGHLSGGVHTTQSGGGKEGVDHGRPRPGQSAARNEVKYSANGWPTEVENLL